MVRAILSGPTEHFVAYAVVAAIAVAGYGSTLADARIITTLSVYAGASEYIRHFSPGRHPSIAKFAGSALGALCGGLFLILFLRRYFSTHFEALPSPCDGEVVSEKPVHKKTR
jgi:VanZ family protein